MRWMTVILLACGVWATSSAQQSPHGTIKTACKACHTTDSWRMRTDATFDHAATRFPLSGQHRAVPCASCHPGLKFAAKGTTCSSCHIDVHLGELGIDCARCHTTRAWSIADMQRRHDETRFPLLGAHAVAECAACHKGEAGRRYRGLPLTCIGCHQTEYLKSSNPHHPGAGFSTECTQCHRVSARRWEGGFDHGLTGFSLTGAHLRPPCSGCHANNVYRGRSSQCISCHQSAFNGTTDPNHVSAGFPVTCERCHSTSAWTPSTFNHAATAFPLTGAHLAVVCGECHTNGQYAGLPTTCSGCHLTDYNSSVNPNHVAALFSQNCTQCHTTTAWRPAQFDHSATAFPLTGRHAAVACIDCHSGGNYQLSYVDCYQCHQTDYTVSTRLNHVALNLSHRCETCHTTTAWLPSTFNHDALYFRIYSGKHQGKWTQCTSCHPNTSAYAQFTCLSCHEHNQTDMNNDHSNVSGYLYASPNCYSCHRNV